MRRIDKKAEPACLEEIRQTPGVTWNSASGKQEIREALWAEQKGLCAYCMSRLKDKSADWMKIEHFIPRAEDKSFWFAWSNLLGVCLGDMGVADAHERFHCDTHRGHLPTDKQELHVHPAQFPPDAGTLFSCTKEGEIIPAKNVDEQARTRIQETIDKLNLNISRLKRNRKQVLIVLQNRLRQNDSPTNIKAMLDAAKRADASGRLMEYAEIAVKYLEKKLRQHNPA
jgi:uncharacterized protein (TIGR02646 family)